MINNFPCPVCLSSSWDTVETYRYSRDDVGSSRRKIAARQLSMLARILLSARPRKGEVTCKHLSKYHRDKREILFNVWYPDQDSVALMSICCAQCGFVSYTPRPEEADIAAKYGHLKRVAPAIGGQAGASPYALHLDAQRAERIYGLFREQLSERRSVLDYGGGNGKLMRPFLAAGHECFVADYNDNPIAGVTKLGNDVSELQGDARFDVIILSHVLEHVSDFPALLEQLKVHLKPAGRIYAEVPVDIWAGLRIEADPVTHINFFTLNSFQSVFRRLGYGVQTARQEVSNYGKAYMEVMWLIATNNGESLQSLPPLPSDAHRYLRPNRTASLKKMIQCFVLPKIRERLWKPSAASQPVASDQVADPGA